jgi:hypothetical protein
MLFSQETVDRGMITQISQISRQAFFLIRQVFLSLLSGTVGGTITLLGAIPIYKILPEDDQSIEACVLLALLVKIFFVSAYLQMPFPFPIANILGSITAVSAPTVWHLLWTMQSGYIPKDLPKRFFEHSLLATTVGVLAYSAANRAETLLRYNLSTLSVVAAFPHILHRGITEVKRNKVSTAIDAAVVSVAMVVLVGSGAAPAATVGMSVACALKCSGRAIVPRHFVRSIVLVGARAATRVFRRIFGHASTIAQ